MYLTNQGKIIMKTLHKYLALFIISGSIGLLNTACEKAVQGPDYNPPSDHTISKNGYLHKSGLNTPLQNCVSCHGADLTGGTSGVSCFECHGTKW
jgi:hypothetical protein